MWLSYNIDSDHIAALIVFTVCSNSIEISMEHVFISKLVYSPTLYIAVSFVIYKEELSNTSGQNGITDLLANL